MTSLHALVRKKQTPKYKDGLSHLSQEEVDRLESESTTVYVGKYPFTGSNAVNESQIYSFFSQCGRVKRIIMGINRNTGEPAGFCFVEFFDRQAALDAVAYLKYTHMGGRSIAVDIDRGFEEGRQYGRGVTGFQKYDERRYGARSQDRNIGQLAPRPRYRGRPYHDVN